MNLARYAPLCLFVACASAPLPKNPPAIEVTNARQPIAGVTTGGKPSEAQLRQAKELGYRTVISLLPEAEMQGEAEEVRALGMKFVSIPIANAGALTQENAQRLAAAMDAPASKPLLLHCASGNRAGALLALKVFYMDAATRADALELGTRAGMTSLRPDVEAKMLAHEQQR